MKAYSQSLLLVYIQILVTDDSERFAIILRGETLAMTHLNTDCTWLEKENAACGVYGSHQVTMGGDTSHDLMSIIACDHAASREGLGRGEAVSGMVVPCCTSSTA